MSAKSAIVVLDPVGGMIGTGALFAGNVVGVGIVGTVVAHGWPAAAVSEADAELAPIVPVMDSGDSPAPQTTWGTAVWKQPVSGSAFQFSWTRGGSPSSHAVESAAATVFALRIRLG